MASKVISRPKTPDRGSASKQRKPDHPGGKKQEQSEQTRARLLHAAEKIFARDGFEAAKLEEIAAAAGYTRGALYANFDSKETLFTATLEEKIHERIRRLREAVDKIPDPTGKLKALRTHFAASTRDCEWTLMALEFKLFALRHPEQRAKVSGMRKRIVSASTAVFNDLLNASNVKLPVSTLAFVIALSGLTHSLELDRLMDKVITKEEIDKVYELFFDCMVHSNA